MKRRTRLMMASVLAMVASKASATALTIDNFETDGNAQIATSSTSTPWLRFGQIGDGLYSSNSSTYLISGAYSAEIPIALTATTGTVTIQKNYTSAAPINLSSYLTATVLSKSGTAGGSSSAALQLDITVGTGSTATTYYSTVAQPEATTAKTFTFSLSPSAFTLAAGAGTLPFATVLGAATSFGFRITDDTTSTAVNEHTVIDDFAVQTNPTSVWTPTTSGDFNAAANWNTGIVPNGIGYEADFSNTITAARTVYSDSSITLATLNFNSPNEYNLTGSGTSTALTMQNSTGAATIIVQQGTQKINLPLVTASNTTFNVASGATLLIANPLTVGAGTSVTSTGAGTVTYQSLITVGTGGSIAFSGSATAAGLTLNASAAAIVAPTGGAKSTLTLNSLSVDPSATLDLSSNNLVVHGGNLSTINNQVGTAFANGNWNGSGITSTTAANDVTHLTALGVAANGSDVNVKYTYYGDSNLDGKVDNSDYTVIDSSFVNELTGPSVSGWSNGDFNYDGVVNGSDYTLIDNAFNTQGSQISSEVYATATAEIAGSSAVPEPASLSLIGIAGVLSLRNRRRRI